jgi:hypothetical protein
MIKIVRHKQMIVHVNRRRPSHQVMWHHMVPGFGVHVHVSMCVCMPFCVCLCLFVSGRVGHNLPHKT